MSEPQVPDGAGAVDDDDQDSEPSLNAPGEEGPTGHEASEG